MIANIFAMYNYCMDGGLHIYEYLTILSWVPHFHDMGLVSNVSLLGFVIFHCFLLFLGSLLFLSSRIVLCLILFAFVCSLICKDTPSKRYRCQADNLFSTSIY